VTGTKIRSELAMIPRWARLLAVLAAAGPALGWWFAMWPPPSLEAHEIVPRILTFGLALFMGSLVAGVILLTGYVNQDARRRGMSAALWTLLVLVIPNGLGFVVYFIARQPLKAPCPQCAAAVPVGVSFCASCGFKVAPVCAKCGRPLIADQPYCPHCGVAVTTAPKPA
jgi:hypothetical protein